MMLELNAKLATILVRIRDQGAFAAIRLPGVETPALDAEVADTIKTSVSQLLLHFGARHRNDCPGARQVYWRMRPEYRSRGWGADKPCVCGLSEIVGLENEARLRP
ncbi:hypothetical protein UFOVP998_32 [uncultured Caudovirales phage]|uniref:Uncharacterized protein n=1 Tax=uncultured Caudovirales phage TaxID=2100421 RepID=A0A6J5S2H4_9CAUD|nr:hypothetical protein UFOVP998_32 [uncultured Caudovirales phage]CAB4199194.1 hypothetical protein UFOVP1331_27 [uncultured Caudovirales phage]CAB4213046.1 hypothetical protein UFOVP1442_48 [uncultured Caudovirales phage]CAB5227933.1 hypothetical protein UFOVP1535_3 [uncultured Caudovirales phage]